MNFNESHNEILNDTQNDTDEFEREPRTIYEYLGFGCSLTMIVVSIVGAIGNGYAVWHFGRPSSRSSVNVLLTALSAFDLILLVTGTPIYSLLGIYSFDRRHFTLLALGYCMTVLYPFSNMAQMGSVWTMCLISFERYLGVCHPFVARRELTVRRARLSVICVAAIAITYNLCRFWEYGIIETGLPVPLLRTDPIYLTIYVHWMYFAFLFSIPFLAIFIFNILVMGGVRRATVNRPRCQISDQMRGERRTTLMLLVVVAVFFGCNSLAWLLNGYEVLGYQPTDPAFEFVSDLNNLLVLAHPAFNIFVYARFSAKFRNEFLYCLCRHLRPSFAGSPPNSCAMRSEYGYSPSTRTAKNYSVLNAAVVRISVDKGDRHCVRHPVLEKQQETCMSSSTTATNVTTSAAENSENSSSVTRELLENNKRQLLKTLGCAENNISEEDSFQGIIL